MGWKTLKEDQDRGTRLLIEDLLAKPYSFARDEILRRARRRRYHSCDGDGARGRRFRVRVCGRTRDVRTSVARCHRRRVSGRRRLVFDGCVTVGVRVATVNAVSLYLPVDLVVG